MISHNNLTRADIGDVASYYGDAADDYYAKEGESQVWQGKGAEELGLSGDVDRDRFRELLDGKVAGQQLGTVRDGQLEHRPGWDVTLSAPKSVSIMAEVAGDRRLIEAHGQAVRTALAHVEAHMAAGAEPARYCYLGEVFRRQDHRGTARPSEYLQAGYEVFDRTDPEAADAEVFALFARLRLISTPEFQELFESRELQP